MLLAQSQKKNVIITSINMLDEFNPTVRIKKSELARGINPVAKWYYNIQRPNEIQKFTLHKSVAFDC
jgi:hypothetical protein